MDITFRIKKIYILQLGVPFWFCYHIFLGLAIKCWVCRSDSDPKCADPFDNSTVPITDCSQEPKLNISKEYQEVKATMCRKIRQKGS